MSASAAGPPAGAEPVTDRVQAHQADLALAQQRRRLDPLKRLLSVGAGQARDAVRGALFARGLYRTVVHDRARDGQGPPPMAASVGA